MWQAHTYICILLLKTLQLLLHTLYVYILQKMDTRMKLHPHLMKYWIRSIERTQQQKELLRNVVMRAQLGMLLFLMF